MPEWGWALLNILYNVGILVVIVSFLLMTGILKVRVRGK